MSRVTRILLLIFVSYVIKEFVDAFSCAYIELWMHLGSLESTQEARVALGCASSYFYASFVLSKLPKCTITRYRHAKHEQILNLTISSCVSVLPCRDIERAGSLESTKEA